MMSSRKVLKRWATRFSKSRRIAVGGEMQSHGSLSLFPEVVIGAGHTVYFCESFEGLPARDRKSALELFAERKSPWPLFSKIVIWHGSSAQVWLWPSEIAGRPAATELPETILLPKAREAGIQLVKCFNGYLLQHWSESLLLAEMWFSELPDDENVAWFCRSRGMPAREASIGSPVADYQPSLWKGFRKPLPKWVSERRAGVGWAAFAAVLLVFTFPITSGLKANALAADYAQQLQHAKVDASELLALRGRARREAFRYQRLYSRLNTSTPLGSQWLVASRLPDDLEYEVIQWQRQGQSVEVVIKANIDDSFRIVGALTGPGVTKVAVEPWRRDNHHVISLELTQPPALTLEQMQGADT